MKKNIGKYWTQYFFREFPIFYFQKSIKSNTYQYFFFIREIFFKNIGFALNTEKNIFFCKFVSPTKSFSCFERRIRLSEQNFCLMDKIFS